MQEFQAIQRLDYKVPVERAEPRLSFGRLFPRARGHMFGVLECRSSSGETRVLRAFSSLHDGIREIEGWVPPLMSAKSFYGRVLPTQKVIEELTLEMKGLPRDSIAFISKREERRQISRELLEEIQGFYRFHNFRGESRSLRDALCRPGPTPGGVGECCAPKLLNYAAREGLEPLGIAEFYWGGSSPLEASRSGKFYAACEERCRPILGFMLCGLKEMR